MFLQSLIKVKVTKPSSDLLPEHIESIINFSPAANIEKGSSFGVGSTRALYTWNYIFQLVHIFGHTEWPVVEF